MESNHAPKCEPQPKVVAGSCAPFNHLFFQTIFPERLRSLCPRHPDDVTVVHLQLADSRELDLCHIELLAPQWMAAAVFRDGASCDNMDTVFVPYEMITRVTISSRTAEEHRLGFKIEHSAAALGAVESGHG